MKQVSDPKPVEAMNGLGRMAKHTETKFEIERHDVGIERPNHRGFGHSMHKFTFGDVGKTITVYTDGSGWTCWMF